MISLSKKNTQSAWDSFKILTDQQIKEQIADGTINGKNVPFMRTLKSKMLADPVSSSMASKLLFDWVSADGKIKTFHLRIVSDFIKFEHWQEALDVAEARDHFKGNGKANELYALLQGKIKYDSGASIDRDWLLPNKVEAFDSYTGSEWADRCAEESADECPAPQVISGSLRDLVLSTIDSMQQELNALRELLANESDGDDD